ncbi:NUDIX domain-containing protein [Actinoplanes flavus]|uniref:NUDIX domain-containing protein n=1 Tax=Actinoplanes flavus TaxID=2820290 RepID=A0ABS3UM44_9ACTN|nr:NUDIX domain-containing protein [Actinoplanes flavus]MBO3738798.1 NUDIX domain-containing protein [Actinoplanes flavus]
MAASPLHPVDVLLILADGDRVLLGLRAGTGFADGQWNLPSGKMEHGESALTAVRREAAEEIGLRLTPGELRLVTTVHHRTPSGHARVGLAFAVTFTPGRHGRPVNAEPHKCARIAWFRWDALPPETYPYSAACVEAWRSAAPLRLSGW